MARVYEIDPLQDERWANFLESHPAATVFHSPEWLRALLQTYGHKPAVLTTAGPGERLTDGVVFCRVTSWLTGRRVVSVPFSDHCAPLADTDATLRMLLSPLKQELDAGEEKYLEIRSSVCDPGAAGMTDASTFCLHRLDLSPTHDELFHGLHESCIRRKILRARRAGVLYEEGTSEDLLRQFYRLMVLTRRRHQVLPQPLSWFRNLLASMGEKAKIRVAMHEGQPAAAIFTLRYKATMTYKYGCSDPRFHRIGPMQLLMWKTIEEAKTAGLAEFDMGRTDWDNPGLLSFKDRWGCARSTLTYMRYPARQSAGGLSFHLPKSVFAFAPNRFLSTAGSVLYQHIG